MGENVCQSFTKKMKVVCKKSLTLCGKKVKASGRLQNPEGCCESSGLNLGCLTMTGSSIMHLITCRHNLINAKILQSMEKTNTNNWANCIEKNICIIKQLIIQFVYCTFFFLKVKKPNDSDAAPYLVYEFIAQTLQPGPPVCLKCSCRSAWRQ